MRYVCFYCYELLEEKDAIKDENDNIICVGCYTSQHPKE